MANLNLNGDVSQNEQILEMAFKDLIVFGKLFSPQDFLASATPDFHLNIGFYLDNIAGKSKTLGPYREGSILRSKDIPFPKFPFVYEEGKLVYTENYNGKLIGDKANAEHLAWRRKGWTEISIEAEETMRKYYKAANLYPPKIYTFAN